jgi:catecholate siderophore receptor
LVGAITEQWQISAGLAKMDSEIVRGNTTAASGGASNTEGGVVRFSPELTFTLWNTYTFTNGFMIGAGAQFVDTQRNTSLTSEQALDSRTLYEIDDYLLISAMASYPINKNISVQLNLMNLTDEEYVASFNNSGARYYPGQPLSARLGVNFAF